MDIFYSVFNNNEGGALNLQDTIIHIHGSEFKENDNSGRGGAIYSSGGTLIRFNKVCTFANNRAILGGALYLDNSVQCFLALGATVIIANNTAADDGGGIYLNHHSNITLQSQNTLQILENRATKTGGGIYVSDFSSINLGFESLSNNVNQIYIYKNQARLGGGLYLGFNSIVYVFLCSNNNMVSFYKNSADYGGAAYIFTEFTSHSDPECSFQLENFRNPAKNYVNSTNNNFKCSKPGKPFYFSLNRANYSGFSLYKRAFNSCSIGGRLFEEFELLSVMSNIQTADIGSFFVQVCYCQNGLPDCSRQISHMNIKTGKKLTLDVAIADRGNHIVNGSIVSEIRNGLAKIRDDQKIQDVQNGCTTIVFNIYSFEVVSATINHVTKAQK